MVLTRCKARLRRYCSQIRKYHCLKFKVITLFENKFLPSNSYGGGDNFIPLDPPTIILNVNSSLLGFLLLYTQSKTVLTSWLESLRRVVMVVHGVYDLCFDGE